MEPKANNKLKTGLLFENRVFYDAIYFPKETTNLINFWKTSFNYGRINKNVEAICIKDTSIKALQDIQSKHFVHSITALAYKEFLTEYKKADFIKAIPKSNLNPLTVKKSLINPSIKYKQHVSDTLDVVVKSNKNLFNNNIFTIQEFINNICSLLLPVTFVLTKTKYITCNLTSPMDSGLCIEHSTSEHDDDAVKASKYIKDQNFNFYVNTAEKYSFFVDKNAPWRLTFNVSTGYALAKINELGYSSLDEFLNNSYDVTYLNDYEGLKQLIIEKYNTLYSNKPKSQMYSFSHEEQKILFDTKFKSNINELEELVWIKLWYFFRLCEERINLSQNQFETHLKYITDLYNIDKEKCLKWIQNQTNPFLDGGTNPSYSQLSSTSVAKKTNSKTFLFRI